QLADAIESGDESQVDALLAEHPDQAEKLGQMMPTLRALVGISSGLAPRCGPGGVVSQQRLGDFYIECEIGRGGMGIVYQARQLSVDRAVALKVLPFAALAGEKSLRRF